MKHFIPRHPRAKTVNSIFWNFWNFWNFSAKVVDRCLPYIILPIVSTFCLLVLTDLANQQVNCKWILDFKTNRYAIQVLGPLFAKRRFIEA